MNTLTCEPCGHSGRWLATLVFATTLAALATMIGCAAQQTPQMQSEIAVTNGCTTAAHSISVLAAARQLGKLTTEQIASVNAAIPTLSAICDAPTPPAGAPDTLASVNAMLERLIFTSEVSPR